MSGSRAPVSDPRRGRSSHRSRAGVAGLGGVLTGIRVGAEKGKRGGERSRNPVRSAGGEVEEGPEAGVEGLGAVDRHRVGVRE